MDASTFAGRLKELRAARGWSQKQLAEAAGMSAAGIADLEQERREPAWRTVLALAERAETIQTRWGLPAAKWLRVFKPVA